MLQKNQFIMDTPHPNDYRHTCPNCGKIFYGRRNRLYCSAGCKIFLNNKKASERRDSISDQLNIYSNNEDLLHRNYRMENTEIDLNFMKVMGFDFRGPCKTIKDEYNGEMWYQVGHYAYNTTHKKDKMIIRKIEALNYENN
jgi:hypothetical protein